MNALVLSRVVLFGSVALSFPAASVAVHGLGADRHGTAAVLSLIYGVGLILALSTSFWPLPELRDWSRVHRVESLVLVYLGMSYFTHLTWELGWLVLRDAIAANPDAPWSYAWWAYIDGGDLRYANPTIQVYFNVSDSFGGSFAGFTSINVESGYQMISVPGLTNADFAGRDFAGSDALSFGFGFISSSDVFLADEEIQLSVDNFKVTINSVPEPAGLLALALGAVLMAGRRRRA